MQRHFFIGYERLHVGMVNEEVRGMMVSGLFMVIIMTREKANVMRLRSMKYRW